MRRDHRMSETRLTRFAAIASALAVWLLPGPGTRVSVGDPFRQLIEADWQRQDECRMAEIRQPGLVRFPEMQLQWPGVMPDERLRVPHTGSPKLDGRLDDPCWQQAASLPAPRADQPSLRLAHGQGQVYVGVCLPRSAEDSFRGEPTALDAGGAVDGVKNGSYAFHTDREPNPWWQVDLGRPRPVARVVVYNRLDYAPGLHNADRLIILTSDDGKQWTLAYDNEGRHFGGVTDGKPLAVDFRKRSPPCVQARFVRLQVRSPEPLWFHLDEVEIYGPEDPGKNLALRRPARQSSLSQWSRGGKCKGGLFVVGNVRVGLKAGEPPAVVADGKPLPAERAAVRRTQQTTQLELALPLAEIPGGFPAELIPSEGPPVRLTPGGNWQIAWSREPELGFGRNRVGLSLRAAGALDPPVRLTVECVVFTPHGPQRQVVLRRELSGAASIPLEFQTAWEGAAAVSVTAEQGAVSVRQGRSYYVPPVRETLQRARRLLADFQIPPPESLQRLGCRAEALARRERREGPDPAPRGALCREARWLARQIAFRNPRLDIKRLLVVKRFTQETYPDICLNHMPWVSRPGGDICILALRGWDQPPEARNLLGGALGPGHVHGMDLSWDADRVVFGYAQARSDRPPAGWLDRRSNFDLRRAEEPTHLFEIGVDGSGLRQLTDGQWSDLDPTYLANGDIAFVSERCGCSLQCNEHDKDETSCNLYVMRPDGSNVRQMSVSKDGDYLPHALADGTLGYTRWEYQERGWAHIQSVWTIRPDGTGADAVFKQHLNEPWALEDVRSVPGGSRLVAVAAGHHTLAAGPVVLLDPRHGLNDPAGIRIVTPGVSPPEGGMSGRPVAQGGVVGRGGFYMTPWPLSEKTFLVCYSYGRPDAPPHGLGREIDPTGYAVYLVDVYGTKELVYRDPEISCFSPLPLRARPRPPKYPDLTEPDNPYAVCAVANAGYGVPGVAPERIRHIRISKRDQWPYDNTYGGQRYEKDVKQVMVNWTPARVIGTVPVEADGSACFRVPADTPVYFQLLDENHMELRRMRSFISFQPGEIRGCVGCHETRAEAPAAGGFPLAVLRRPRIPTPPPWGKRAISFLHDVQPVFDRHCVSCHGGLKPEAGLDFSGGLTANNNRAYDTILAHGLVSRSNVGDDARVTPPLAFGSHRSKLVAVLRDEVHREQARLSCDDWLRLVTWIDLNGPYHDGFINKRRDPPAYDLPADRALIERIAAVHATRCGACHQPAEVTRADWIDLRQPRRSLFLSAPLAREAGGSGRCRGPVYRSRADPDYQSLLGLVESAVAEAWARPRRDLRVLSRR